MPESIQYDTGAVRGSDVSDFIADLPLEALHAFANALEDGKAKGYPRDNWKKGFPTRSVIAHLLVHILRYREGDTSEDHLSHALFNLVVLIRQQGRPDLDDREPPCPLCGMYDTCECGSSIPDEAPHPKMPAPVPAPDVAGSEAKLKTVFHALVDMEDMFRQKIEDRPGPDDAADRWDKAVDAIALVRSSEEAPTPEPAPGVQKEDSMSRTRTISPRLWLMQNSAWWDAQSHCWKWKGQSVEPGRCYALKRLSDGKFFECSDEHGCGWTDSIRQTFLISQIHDLLRKTDIDAYDVDLVPASPQGEFSPEN